MSRMRVVSTAIPTAVVAVLLQGLIHPAEGQRPPTPPPSEAVCDSAALALRDGWRNPENWLLLPSCGERGIRAVEQALRNVATLTDEESLSYLAATASMVRDPRISDAAIHVASQQGAPTAARVVAILAGLSQHAPFAEINMRVPFADLLSGRPSARCPLLSGHSYPLPKLDDPARRAEFRSALGAIATDESAVQGLRQLAGCALSLVRPEPAAPAGPRPSSSEVP